MNELNKHVDGLFKKYKCYPRINELKEEILSNLEAKKADLISKGLSEKEAVEQAKKDVGTIDYLIDDNRCVYINRARWEWLQAALLYLLTAWVITIPLSVFPSAYGVNLTLFVFTVLTGILYLIISAKKDEHFINKKRDIPIKPYQTMKKIGWAVWIIYVFISIVKISGIFFGSNVFFSRPIHIDGPYQWAKILLEYAIPFIWVIVPLAINRYVCLLLKYEAGVNNE